MKKNITMIIVAVLCMLFLTNVKADFDSTITIEGEGSSLTLNSSLDVVRDTSLDEAIYPWFHIKNSNKGNVICLSGLTAEAPGATTTCNLVSNDNYGAAYIIDLINHTTAQEYEKYYWSEVLVNGYLGTLEQLDSPTSFFYTNVISNNNKKILSTKLSFSQIIDNAKDYNTNVITNPEITVNGNKSAEVEFELGSDGYYYSNSINIDSNVNYTLKSISDKFSPVKNGNSYVFKIKESDIALGSVESFSVVFEATSTYKTSSRYNCGDSVQNVGLNYVETKQATDSINISGSVTRQKTAIAIRKFDENNMNLSGATLLFQTESEKGTNKGIKLTSEGKYMPIRNLDPGTYYLSEITAPIGYNKLKGSIEIVIDKSGKVYFDGDLSQTHVIDIYNTKTKTKFSKISIANQKELPGATLTILNENKEIIADEEGNALYEWISGKEPHYIEGLPIGKYYLKEVKAPEGYAITEEIVAFEVKGDGTVTEVVMENALEVEVPDTLSSRSILLLVIGMFDIALGIGILLYVKKNKATE